MSNNIVEYNGHKVEVRINYWGSSQLIIDGELKDKKYVMVSGKLKASLKMSSKKEVSVLVNISSGWFGHDSQILIDGVPIGNQKDNGRFRTSAFHTIFGLLVLGSLSALFNSHSLIRTLFTLAQLACLYGIWNWKKWGIWGFAIVVSLQIIVNIFTGGKVYWPGIVIIVLIYFAIYQFILKPVWKHFE